MRNKTCHFEHQEQLRVMLSAPAAGQHPSLFSEVLGEEYSKTLQAVEGKWGSTPSFLPRLGELWCLHLH